MDAIILAAGKGTRMRPLTNDTPKPLLHVQGKPILEWSLINLDGIADRVIVVAKYLKQQVIDYMDSQTIIKNYVVIEQLPEPMGTGHALQCCQPYLESDDFLVLNGDDLFDVNSIQAMSEKPAAILAIGRDDPTRFGVIVTDDDGKLVKLHEKPPAGLYPTPAPVNIGAYKMTTEIFNYDIPLSARGEYEITDYVTYLATKVPVSVIHTDFWQPIGNPQDLEFAQTVKIPTRG